MSMNIFEYAARNKIRFATTRGELSVEHLWDLPLLAKDGFDLNTVAKAMSTALKDLAEDSFVQTERTPEHTRREVRLEIVKHIISDKIAAADAAKKREKKREERNQLMAILAEKQAGLLSEMSIKDLQERIAALSE